MKKQVLKQASIQINKLKNGQYLFIVLRKINAFYAGVKTGRHSI